MFLLERSRRSSSTAAGRANCIPERPSTKYPRLMSPLKLRDQTLRNRIVFGAHTANMSDQGMPGPRFGKYLLERALGGAAMVVAALEVSLSLRCLLGPRVRGGAR